MLYHVVHTVLKWCVLCSNVVYCSAVDRKPWTKAEAEQYRGMTMARYTAMVCEREAAQDMLNKEALEKKKQAIEKKYPLWPVFKDPSLESPYNHHAPGG